MGDRVSISFRKDDAEGKMGWWAVVSNEKKGWRQECRKILEANKDFVAVLCDLHI